MLINIVANLIAGRFLHPLQNVLDSFEVVAVVIRFISRGRIEGGKNLNLHDITEIVLGIKFPPHKSHEYRIIFPLPRLDVSEHRRANRLCSATTPVILMHGATF